MARHGPERVMEQWPAADFQVLLGRRGAHARAYAGRGYEGIGWRHETGNRFSVSGFNDSNSKPRFVPHLKIGFPGA
jgi:hypothetical protein